MQVLTTHEQPGGREPRQVASEVGAGGIINPIVGLLGAISGGSGYGVTVDSAVVSAAAFVLQLPASVFLSVHSACTESVDGASQLLSLLAMRALARKHTRLCTATALRQSRALPPSFSESQLEELALRGTVEVLRGSALLEAEAR